MPYSHLETECLSLEEQLQKLKVDQLKPLARRLLRVAGFGGGLVRRDVATCG